MVVHYDSVVLWLWRARFWRMLI